MKILNFLTLNCFHPRRGTQEPDQIRRVRIADFPGEGRNRCRNGARMPRLHRVFVPKNNAGVGPLFGCPEAKQIRNGSLIEGHEEPPLSMTFRQNVLISGAQIGTGSPSGQLLRVEGGKPLPQSLNRCF
jgi:hypothetical protein